MASFVNSRDALVEWNSLLIDRYDVRHLLQAPPQPVKRRVHTEEDLQLDEDQYLDLTSPSDVADDQENAGAEDANASGFHAVGFSYGNTDNSNDPKIFYGYGFLPPFLVPESLVQSLILGAGWSSSDIKFLYMRTMLSFDLSYSRDLTDPCLLQPPTEKLHQIMVMVQTALFVSKHGGQSEIVLRVKQGNNPMFSFLMPGHHLHAYFRFFVDNPKLLEYGSDAKPEEVKKADQERDQTGVVAGGALSLLGYAYDSGEDDDGTLHSVSESIDNKPEDIIKNVVNDKGLERQASSGHSTGKDSTSSNHSLASAKETAPLCRKMRASSSTAVTEKKESDAVASLPGSLTKMQTSTLPSAYTIEPPIVEPPSDLMVEKIIEFILKNGKEFEAVLREQDITNGRFPFLLPSNKYHP